MKNVSFVLVLLALAACSSCIRKQGRPNAELCLYLEEAKVWECEDSFGKITVENEGNLIATTVHGYTILERYIDGLELKVKELQTQVNRCTR